MKLQLVVSCEHASNAVPEAYQSYFHDAQEDLVSHKGWDPGSLEIANYLGKLMAVQPFEYPYTRLLIEPNRSLDQADLFSAYSKSLPDGEKELLIGSLYQPYRDRVESEIKNLISAGPVLHLGIHTFTPIWHDEKREVEIGLLFDPGRKLENRFATLFNGHLSGNGFVVRDNEPYQGIADGFTTYLRNQFSDEEYLGFEIEVSQGLINQLDLVNATLGKALQQAKKAFEPHN